MKALIFILAIIFTGIIISVIKVLIRKKQLFRTAKYISNILSTNYSPENVEKAIEIYNLLIKTSPKNFIYYIHRSNCFYDLRNYEKSSTDLSTAIRLIKQSKSKNKIFRAAKNISEFGFIHDSSEHVEKAIELYDVLINMSPKHFRSYNNRGNCYLAINNYEKARSDLSKSIQLEPDQLTNFIAYDNMERLEEELKNQSNNS